MSRFRRDLVRNVVAAFFVIVVIVVLWLVPHRLPPLLPPS